MQQSIFPFSVFLFQSFEREKNTFSRQEGRRKKEEGRMQGLI
jgi:hypothetical protein